MGVNRSEDWGALGLVPSDAWRAASNADLLELLGDLKSDSVVALTGGDLCRTLGGRGRAFPGGEATLVDIDMGEALVDGRLHRFAAHLVVRPSRHPGRWWVAANAAHRGRWNVAPRAHPGDGLLDVLDASLSLGDVVAAWRRLGSGVHVPHPAVRQERTTATQMSFGGSARAWLDGRPIGPIDKLSLRVESGALRVAV